MRRMIPENQQEALRKLTSKEALLGLMALGQNSGIDSMTATIDSDGLTYVHISGNALLSDGKDEYFELLNIPEGLQSADDYIATNDNGGGCHVNVLINGTVAKFTFNDGAVGRVVYFSVLLAKHHVEI